MSEGHIRQRSAGSWELKYEAEHDPATGERRTRYKTVKGTKRDAQKELRRLLGRVDQGTDADAGKLTVGAYLDQWLAGHRATVAPRTAERYGEHIEKHIKPILGNLPLAKLTTLRLNAYYADKLATGRLDGTGGLSAQTVRHLDRLLHTALRDAVAGHLIPFNPLAPEWKPKRPMSKAEFTALLDRAKGGRLYAPILVILATGLRRGELLALKWRYVDLEAGVLFVVEAVEETRAGMRIKDVKTEASRRRVDLPAFAVEALSDRQHEQKQEHLALGIGWSPDTLVFDNGLGQIRRPRNFTKEVTRIAASIGIMFTPHLGRHDHFTRLLETGVHPKVAQVRAGHSSISVTMNIYSHATDALQLEAMERIQDAFENIQGGSGGKPVAKALSGAKGTVVKL
jgi:integrase